MMTDNWIFPFLWRELVLETISAVCPFYYSHYLPLCICSARQSKKQIKRRAPLERVVKANKKKSSAKQSKNQIKEELFLKEQI